MGKSIAESPYLRSCELIGYTYAIEHIPMMGQDAQCVDQGMTFTIHMVRLRAASIKLEDRKISPGFEVVDRCALNIISPEAQARTATQCVEGGQQCGILFMTEVDQQRAAAQVECLRQYKSLARCRDSIEFSGMAGKQFVLAMTRSVGSQYQVT